MSDSTTTTTINMKAVKAAPHIGFLTPDVSKGLVEEYLAKGGKISGCPTRVADGGRSSQRNKRS